MENKNEPERTTSPELLNSGSAKELCAQLVNQHPNFPIPDFDTEPWGDAHQRAWGAIIKEIEVAYDTKNLPNAADNLQGPLRELYRDGHLRVKMGQRSLEVTVTPNAKILWNNIGTQETH